MPEFREEKRAIERLKTSPQAERNGRIGLHEQAFQTRNHPIDVGRVSPARAVAIVIGPESTLLWVVARPRPVRLQMLRDAESPGELRTPLLPR